MLCAIAPYEEFSELTKLTIQLSKLISLIHNKKNKVKNFTAGIKTRIVIIEMILSIGSDVISKSSSPNLAIKSRIDPS